MFVSRCKKRLTLQKQNGLYRDPFPIDMRQGRHILHGSRRILNFASNDYLGLSGCANLRLSVASNFEKYGPSASSSRLVSGNYSLTNQAEKAYAEFFDYEQALFFPSGYQANLGILSALFEPGDTLFFDKHVHASMVKGASLSRSAYHGYNHSNLKHLEKRLAKHQGHQAAVLTESLFSMDGDMLDVETFTDLKSRFGFFAIVDEAHAFGVLGDSGRGIARHTADIAVGTFGKAFGLFGAFVLLPSVLKEYFFNFSSPLIYTTTLPAAHSASALDLLAYIADSDDKRNRLKAISSHLKIRLLQEGFKVKGDAHIVAVKIGNESEALNLARYLLSKDIYVLAARYPTVPLGQAILRIGMTADHEEEDIERLILGLKEFYGKHN